MNPDSIELLLCVVLDLGRTDSFIYANKDVAGCGVGVPPAGVDRTVS